MAPFLPGFDSHSSTHVSFHLMHAIAITLVIMRVPCLNSSSSRSGIASRCYWSFSNYGSNGLKISNLYHRRSSLTCATVSLTATVSLIATVSVNISASITLVTVDSAALSQWQFIYQFGPSSSMLCAWGIPAISANVNAPVLSDLTRIEDYCVSNNSSDELSAPSCDTMCSAPTVDWATNSVL